MNGNVSAAGGARWTGGGWVLPGLAGGAPVIDAHYHIFPRLGSQPRGIPPALRLKFWQYHSREWSDFWRTDTGQHVAERLLEFGSHSIADMPDVGFRLTDHGQAEITVDGVSYRLQIYPPSLTNNEATPERMVAEMDLAGVDAGVLQSDHVYGDLNEYYAEACARYPGRFIALAQIWEPDAADADRLARLRTGFDELGMRGLYFSVEPLSVMRIDRSLNDRAFAPLWRLVEERGLPVFWFLDDRALDRVGMFMRRVAELDEWTRRHPQAPCVITHGLVPAAIIHDIGVPEELLRVLDRPQVHAELLMPAKWPDYPYPEGQRLLRALRDRVGAESLLWGSDSPYGMTQWCTYRQSLDFIRVHCGFLSADERAAILGGNAARLFGLDDAGVGAGSAAGAGRGQG